MNKEVKAVRIGDKIILFIDGKRQTVSRKVAPEAFEQAVQLIKDKNTEKLREMFTDVNKKISDFAKDIFTIKGNNVYAKGENEPAPKLVARKLFEMMQTNVSPEPLAFLNKKMQRNGRGVAAGMDIFSKLDDIPMTKKGNLILKVGMTKEQLDRVLRTQGTVVGSPRGCNGNNITHDLPVCDFDVREIYDFVYCLVDPSDILAFFNGDIRVGRYQILKNFNYKKSSVIDLPLEELFDISFDIWQEQQGKQLISE